MQPESSENIGPACPDGETCGSLLPTPTAHDRHHRPGTPPKGSQIPLIYVAAQPTLMASVVDSPVSQFRWQELDAETLMNAGCGPHTSSAFASLSPDGCWLRTYQGCYQRMLDGSFEEFCETCPSAGLMLSGRLYQRVPLVHRISEKESSLLPTPYASMSRKWKLQKGSQASDRNLESMARKGLLPTPTARDWRSGKGKTQAERGRTAGPSLSQPNGGLLNPQFVEAIMGFPTGWTELDV